MNHDRLFDAAWTCDRVALARLLREGCDPRVERDGLTPLHIACANGSAATARLLLRAGARVDAEAWPDRARLAWIAASLGRWSSDPALPPAKLPGECPPATPRDGWWRKITSLTRRSFVGEENQGALGCTPLHLACDAGHVKAVSLLLAHGADPYLEVYLDGGPEGFWEWTPMTLAGGQPQDGALAEILTVLETHLQRHPRSEASTVEQLRRRALIPD